MAPHRRSQRKNKAIKTRMVGSQEESRSLRRRNHRTTDNAAKEERILGEAVRMKSNIDALEIITDLESWANKIDAKVLQIKSALITLREYVKDVEKDGDTVPNKP